MRKFGFLLLLTLFLPLLNLHAQTALSLDDIVGDFTFVLNPEIPQPDSTVHVEIQNYAIDMTQTSFVWTVNGGEVAHGEGVTSIDVRVGAPGSHTTVDVDMQNGDTPYERSIIITPGSVDLLWQGDTYAPPFYKGRTLWGELSNVTVLAIPDTGTADSSRLVYKWSLNGTALGNYSGVGRNSLTISDSPLSMPQEVTAVVATDATTFIAENGITLTPNPPVVAVYEDNPLYGIVFDSAVSDSVTLNDQEVSFVAAPFFGKAASRSNSIFKYSWSVNGSPDNLQKGTKVTYRAPAGGSGASQIGVSLTDPDAIYQSTPKTFLVQFGNAATF